MLSGTVASALDGVGVDVRREDVHRDVRGARPERFEQAYGDRIRLFAARARRNPDADRVTLQPARDEPRDHDALERLERAGVAEEVGHVDEKILVELLQLVRLRVNEAQVVVEPIDALHRHAPLDASLDRGLLVVREVVTERIAEEDVELLHPRRLRPGAARRHEEGMLRHLRERGPDGGGRERAVDDAGLDRAARHAVELRGLRRLHEADAASLLDRLEPERPVRAHPREDDPDRARAAILGERSEEEIDRETRRRFNEVELAAKDRHLRAGRGDVKVVLLDRPTVGDGLDLHARRT